jgi:ribosomal protein L11 methylase PrmA
MRRYPVLTLATNLLAMRGVARSTASLAPDPRSQCERYTDDTYAKMRDDAQRTLAYQRAIEAIAPGRNVLDIGTGALALLAVMAAKAGANHVYAVEANAHAFAAAEQAVAEQGLSDRITVLHGYSTDVVLPSPVDLLVHEVRGGRIHAALGHSSRLSPP